MRLGAIKTYIKEKLPYPIFKRLIYYRYKLTKESLAFLMMRFFKVDNKKIVICNMFGNGFGDNPKYVALELLKYPQYDIVWLVNNMQDDSIPKEIRKVKYGTWKAYYELATAKIWIDNARKSIATVKKNKQFYIHTGHGGIPLKKVEAAAEKIDRTYIVLAQHDSAQIDLMISNSDMKTSILKEDYWYEGEIGIWGSPKIEALDKYNSRVDFKVKEYYKLHRNTKILLYAPTFRQTNNLELLDINYSKLRTCVENKFGGKWVVFIRLHPLIASQSKEVKIENQDIINVTDYPDMQELLTVSDVLITDYSGTMFEMLQVEKPVFLYAPDIDTYERGFYFNLKDLPFLLAESEEQLSERIKEFSYENYKNKIKDFKKKIGLIEGKSAARKCAERVAIEVNR